METLGCAYAYMHMRMHPYALWMNASCIRVHTRAHAKAPETMKDKFFYI